MISLLRTGILLGACLFVLQRPLIAAEADGNPTPGKQVAASATFKIAGDDSEERDVTLRYWLFLPADYSADETKRWPLLLFLHGGGERGDDLELVKAHGPPKLIESKPDFPCITISPQCPQETRWNAGQLAKLVDFVANTLRVDRQRLYVTGLSMGGAGTWSQLAQYPGLFAAAIPICGRGDLTQVEAIAKTPVWVTVGAKDQEKTVKGNEELVAALRKAGGTVGFTLYPHLEHDCWTTTYDDPVIWKWLLSQQLTKQAAAKE